MGKTSIYVIWCVCVFSVIVSVEILLTVASVELFLYIGCM